MVRNTPYLTSTMQSEHHGVYNADVITQMGIYPVLARMIYRGDLQEGPVVAERNVHLQSLKEGKIGFVETVEQDWDQKEFTGIVPESALAVGRVVIDFTEKFEPTKNPDISSYIDSLSRTVNAATGQLSWNYGNGGFFTINSSGTKGLVGFARDKKQVLGNVTIETSNKFATILLTSLEKDKEIENASSILVVTLARMRNTGMLYNEDTTELVEVGGAPLLLEPVNAKLTINRDGTPVITALDHYGRITGQKIQARGGVFNINSGKYKTMYYLVEY